MKKRAIVFLLFFFTVVITPPRLIYAEDSVPQQEAVFVFPSSLEKIEDEAFQGTAVTTAVFSEKLQSIGENTFEHASLKDVYIPPSTQYIGKFAFRNNPDLTIHGIMGSYAEEWATEQQVPFSPCNIWNLLITARRTLETQEILGNLFKQVKPLKIAIKTKEKPRQKERSMRPQDRPELNAIEYRFP